MIGQVSARAGHRERRGQCRRRQHVVQRVKPDPLQLGAEIVAEGITRLGVSLILTPEGPIPLDNDEGLRAYFARYLVPGIARLAAS